MTRGALAFCSIAVTLLAPAVASAQAASDAVRADALFNAGKQLRDAGQWADACPNFAESKRLSPGVGISLYLADCYEHTGHLSSAYQEFRDAERLARERNDQRAETAHARALALESKLGGLLIAVPSAASGEAPEILLDGSPVPPEKWNVAMTVEPGDHVITVDARGQPPRTLKAHVDAGYRPTTLQVDESEAPPPPVAAAAPPASATDTTAATANTSGRVWTGAVLTAVGAIGIGIGTWLALTAPTPPPSCTPPPQDNRTTAEAVGFAAGTAALLGGVLVLTIAPHKSATGMTVSPMTMTSGAGAMLRANF